MKPLSPSRPRRLSCLLALSIALALPASGEWPQWRGPSGLGISAAPGPLPSTWAADGTGLRWRTQIPGEGTSSPIVSNGRVFLTTAYDGPRSEILRLAGLGVVAALSLAFLAWVVRRRRAAGELGRGERLVTALSLAFVLLAVGISLWPDLFYTVGKPGRTWRTTGALALIGLVAAFGWFRPRSRWRLLGVVVLLLGAGYVAYLMPPGKVGPAPWEKRLTFVLPALIGAFLYARGYLRRRARPAPASTSQPAAAALPLLLLSLLVFVPPNYLNGLLRVVVCLDLDSGRVLWERPAFAAPPEQKWPGGTYATPTPATDGELVYAYFGAGVAALDFEGDLHWALRFPEYSRYARYGAGASPVLVDDALIVVQEKEAYQGGPPGFVVALDKRSGRTRWRITPERARDSYNTPLVYRSGSEAQLITASWGFLAAYDAATGEALWTLDYPMMQIVASMARVDDVIAVSGGAHGDKVLMVVRLAAAGAREPPVILWESRRSVARVPSPVFYRGLLFTLTDSGILTCYEADTGTELWKKRLEGDYFSSPVAGDGKIYAVNTDGATSVIQATPDYRLIAVNELDEAVYASPAIADGCLLIRTAGSLVCIAGDPKP